MSGTIKKHIKNIKTILKNFSDNTDKKVLKRNRELNFKKILLFLTNIVTNDHSCSIALSELKSKDIINATKQAIIKKRNNNDSKYFKQLHLKLVDYIDNNDVTRKIFAVDGSQLSINKKLQNDGFRLTKRKTYCKALLSTIYNVKTKIPFNSCITNHSDERKAFADDLLNNIPPNSIIIFDRGYYSQKLIKLMKQKNLFYIFRMKKSSLYVKDLISNNIYDKHYDGSRLVQYNINNNFYHLLTNINDKTINELKICYHVRWSIEEFYKTIKCNMKMNNIQTKDINKINQELYVHLIVTTLTRYFEFLIKTNFTLKNTSINKDKYDINNKVALKIMGNNIIYFLFKNGKYARIFKYLEIIFSEKVYVVHDRHYNRIRIKPHNKWYYLGISII